MESEYVDYEEESSASSENEDRLEIGGEYVLPPQDRKKETQHNEQRAPARPRDPEGLYDSDLYSIAQPENCPTKHHGVQSKSTPEKVPNLRERIFKTKKSKISLMLRWSVMMMFL